MFYRGRLAPSPTGYLHLGHARTFLVAAERATGGTLVLRNDDLDTQRCQPHFVQAMLQDLDWLGIRWQEGPQTDGGESGEFGPYAQSLRGPRYRDAFERLRSMGAIYPCVCSRRDLQSASRAPHAGDDEEPIYPGTCRDRSFREGDQAAWRFRVPDGEAIRFTDNLSGPQEFVAGQDFSDFAVLRRDGVPSYQLACVVDDAAMRITEVVRGSDLLRSTARQILLIRALGLPQPAYAHTPLVVNERGERLAKRDDARSIRTLREAGLTPAEVRAMAMQQ
ncbi:glutamyl- or glutaminyl-tRNA synthetase [Terriglobus roseus DSM 18391]|uniref:Glutamyl-or glutaminyl-tRNA synthetase n=1 Tax=Terriglobus roseus (strain DSM 18391 / NRRL B-41598 / KBS 63) TaxID=926566 RepID=I3ZC34_TERRK|nr:tRNA glutamyl-Q(34) synthetase GluQRS [Terriglobus roseus]AFL86802.1 glutamyl- or glutaminyl-tRNA synthetase [Terriglobus roseus DSM 18391]